LGLSNLSISSLAGASRALASIDSAIGIIDSKRADLGAIQNRFQSTIRNLSNIVENVSSARSRIKDTDFAKETAELTRSQILQQASTTILAQSNQRPQSALSLLQG
jgi:flagellin